ncbi:unnamed protein product [Paramecium primaurelia]|uniref:non-specific serine/threonine protein kinase n=1 Tax=Paramecium primaurelia TaxID=5886 RepID=A0A8S1NDT4_PARPR|nr:unnamed protein product [Paramecium primaurelia]
MDNQQLMNKKWLKISREEKFEDFYELDKKEVSSGSHGQVYRTKHKVLGYERALKIIPKNFIIDTDNFKKSIEQLQNFDHPNVIKLFESFEDTKNIYLVMELCTGGGLFDKLIDKDNYTEKEAQEIFLQIIQAINYCHFHGICHRDLKPEHILFLDKTPNSPIKVIGFEDSVFFHDNAYKTKDGKTQITKKIGTPYYIAPEVLGGKYDEVCDIWSAGVILYILLTGDVPFNGTSEQEILKVVKSGIYNMEIPKFKEISNDCKDLISKMLIQSDQRLKAEQVLKHPWLIQLYHLIYPFK